MQQPIHLISFGIFSMFLLLGLYLLAAKQIQVEPDTKTVYVTAKISASLDDATWAAIERRLILPGDIAVAYQCHESGIIILHIMRTTLTNRGDLHTLLHNRMREWVNVADFILLDIHYHSSSAGGNC